MADSHDEQLAIPDAVIGPSGPGLGSRLIATWITIVALLLLVLTGLGVRAVGDGLRADLQTRAQSLARTLASAVAGPAARGDLDRVARILDGAMDGAVDYAVLESPLGELLAAGAEARPPAGAPARALGAPARIELDGETVHATFDAEAPVLGGQLGSIRIGVSEARIRTALLGLGKRYLPLALAAGALAALLAAIMVRRTTAPLRRLADVARALGMGDRAVRPAVETRDEVGVVAEALSDALGRAELSGSHTEHDQRERQSLLSGLGSLREMVEAAAEGDLTRPAKVETSTLAPLADALEGMRGALRERLGAVRDASDRLQHVAAPVFTGDETVAVVDAAAFDGEETVAVDDAGHDLGDRLRHDLGAVARAMGEIARHAAKIHQVSGHAGSRALSGQRRVTRALEGQQQVQLAVQGTAQRLGALEHRLESFRSIVDSIAQLAAGTEIGQVGEEADRVRGLAADLAQASHYIHAQMDNAVREVRDATAATAQSSRAVVSAVETTRAAGDRIQELVRAAAATADLSERISQAASLDDVESMSRTISNLVRHLEARDARGGDATPAGVASAAEQIQRVLTRFELGTS